YDPHPEFHQSHVRFGMELHKVSMHRKLTTTAQRKIERRGYDRDGRVPQPHGGILESLYRHVQLIVILLHGHHENHTDIRAGGEVGSIVTDDQSAEVLFCQIDGLMQPLDDIAPYRIHLRVELRIKDAIAEVGNRKPAVLPDGFLLADVIEDNKTLGTGNGFVRF